MVERASEISGQAGSGQPLAKRRQKEEGSFALRHKNTIPGNLFQKRKSFSSVFRGGEGAVACTSAAGSAAQQLGSVLVPQLSRQLS